MNSLPILIVNPYNRCNCRCVMCDIWKRDTVEEITFEQFARQLPAIESLGVQRVVFSGGEPLMHPDLFRFCAQLRERNIAVTLLSSGLLLERHSASIAEHVDDVIVSLDGPPEIHARIRRVSNAFDLLARGVRRIQMLRPEMPVAARCTVQRGNCAHLTATVDTARSLRLDSISFLAADLHSTAFNRSDPISMVLPDDGITLGPADLRLLDEQIESLVGAGDCSGFILESPEKLRKIARHFHCYLGLAEPVAPLCNAPWKSAVIEADGSVKPCFFHPAIGRLTPDSDLREVLGGPAAVAFRAGLNVSENPICRQCVCSLNWKSGS